jgi:hypothetical protein
MTTMLYIAGRIVDDKDKKAIHWQLLGVFETSGGAEGACTTNQDFVRPVKKNTKLPEIGPRPTAIYFPRNK